MDNKRNKTILLNSLIFVFCVVIIILYCLVPPAKKPEIASLQTYQVIFDTDGGTVISSISVEEGHAIEAPDTPTKEGYIFDGWVVDDVSYDFSQIISGDIVLKARWREVSPDTTIYTVKFETDSGTSFPDQLVEENGKVTRPPSDPVKDKFKFVEWQLDGQPYDFEAPVTSNITLVAKWEEEDENKTYTVKFDLNGGNGSKPADQTVKTGEKAKVPSETPKREKYDFKGWSTSRNASSPNIGSVVIRNDTTFYAVWVSNVKSYRVSVNLNNGQADNCNRYPDDFEENTYLPTSCTNPRRDPSNGYRYEFNGWRADDGESHDNLSQFKITKNTNITANWNQIKVTTYTYTLKFSGVTGCSDKVYSDKTNTSWKFEGNDFCTSYSTPALQHFDGWYNQQSGGSKVTSVTVNSDAPTATVYGRFANNSYTVTCTHPIDPNSNAPDDSTCKFGISSSYSTSGLHIEYTNKRGRRMTIQVNEEQNADIYNTYSFDVCNSSGTCVGAGK